MKFKLPSSYGIIFIAIIIVAILTWIIPAGLYPRVDGDIVGPFAYVEQNPQGIWHIFAAAINGFYGGIDVALFIIVLGGFINVIIQTGALEKGIASITRASKGREEILIVVLMVLFGIGGSTYGMAEETIAFYLIIIPAFLLAGYDVMVPFMVIMLGAGVGVLASTVNPFATGVASASAGVAVGDGIVHRIIMFVVLQTATIAMVVAYARRVKKDPSKSVVADLHSEHLKIFDKEMSGSKDKDSKDNKMSGKDAFILSLMGISFLVMVVTLIPWEDFGITIFREVSEIFINIPILGFTQSGLEADFVPVGEWYFAQLSTWFLFMAIIISFVSGMGEKKSVQAFINGSRDILEVSLIVALARGIKSILEGGLINDTIIFSLSESLEGFAGFVFLILSYIVFIPLSFLIPSTSGLATATMPIMGPLAERLQGVGAPAMITAYQSASGIVNLITPTSGVVVGALALSHIPYGRWLAFSTRFLIMLFVLTILFLIPIALGWI